MFEIHQQWKLQKPAGILHLIKSEPFYTVTTTSPVADMMTHPGTHEPGISPAPTTAFTDDSTTSLCSCLRQGRPCSHHVPDLLTFDGYSWYPEFFFLHMIPVYGSRRRVGLTFQYPTEDFKCTFMTTYLFSELCNMLIPYYVWDKHLVWQGM
jgi:hypothetical protein